MPIDINAIKYIPDLPAAKALSDGDLLHISQGGVDGQLTLRALEVWLNDKMHPLGQLLFFGIKGRNPNTLFPGQTWIRVGQGQTFRGCQDNETDLGTNAGSDSVSLAAANIPGHSHSVSITTGAGGAHGHTITVAAGGAHAHTASTAGGGAHGHTASTASNGNHYHEYGGDDQLNIMGAIYSRMAGWYDADSDNDHQAKWYKTNTTGAHTHGVTVAGVGNHTHGVTVNTAAAHAHSASASQQAAHTHSVNGTTGSTGNGSGFSVLNKVTYIAAWRRTA